MPTVSVVVPTRNRARLLARTLRSVLAQEAVDLEVVVVDDGSTDETGTLLDTLDDARVRVFRTDHSGGVSAARNRGIAEARGAWLAFLDDDDLWSPTKLAKQLAAAAEQQSPWAYTGVVAVDGELQIVAGGPPWEPAKVAALLPYRNVVPAGSSNVIVRRELLDSAGEFDVRLRHMADWDMWIRLSLLSAPASVAEPLVAYLLHAGNASLDTHDIPDELEVMEHRYEAVRQGRTVDRAYVYRWIAWSALREGQRHVALRWYWRATRAGDRLSAARALMALLFTSRGRYGRAKVSADWAGRADGWLAAIRQQAAEGDG